MDYNVSDRAGLRQFMPHGMNPYERPMSAMQAPIPFYKVYSIPDLFQTEAGRERDMNMIKSMYPKAAKEVQEYVEQECDKMEYDGSLMFDDYPDKEMLRLVSKRIYEHVKDRYELAEEEEQDEMIAMNRRYWKGYRGNWMNDLVDVLLFNEIFRRRCRRRDCGRWWY
jgi:hypothetical protein